MKIRNKHTLGIFSDPHTRIVAEDGLKLSFHSTAMLKVLTIQPHRRR